MSNDMVPTTGQTGAELFRQSTDAAGLCRELVLRTAKPIQGRKFLPVEAWQSVAVAHSCVASARDVEKVDGGYRAIGEIRRMSDGVVIAQAEGFVGEDEHVWFGGGLNYKTGKPYEKRADYAIRAMAQTRAISRACRSAFAHVVVMMNAGLSTTPAEEVPHEGFDDDKPAPRKPRRERAVEGDVVSTQSAVVDSQERNMARQFHLDAIKDAKDMDALKAAFTAATKELGKDADIIKMKDDRKIILEAIAAEQEETSGE